jgi:hypothetical protein
LDEAKYGESALVDNRVAVLLFGGTAEERQAWAEETAQRLGSLLTLVTTAAALPAALAQARGVVYLPGILALGEVAQQRLVQCLQRQEERPKLVVGVEATTPGAVGLAGLRPDLHYRLRLAQVNLDEPGLRDAISTRRAQRMLAARSSARPASKRAPSRPPSRSKRPKPPRRGAAAKGKRPKRAASAKRSRRSR